MDSFVKKNNDAVYDKLWESKPGNSFNLLYIRMESRHLSMNRVQFNVSSVSDCVGTPGKHLFELIGAVNYRVISIVNIMADNQHFDTIVLFVFHGHKVHGTSTGFDSKNDYFKPTEGIICHYTPSMEFFVTRNQKAIADCVKETQKKMEQLSVDTEEIENELRDLHARINELTEKKYAMIGNVREKIDEEEDRIKTSIVSQINQYLQ